MFPRRVRSLTTPPRGFCGGPHAPRPPLLFCRLLPPCSHAGIPFSRVSVCVCISDVYLTASHHTSHDRTSPSYIRINIEIRPSTILILPFYISSPVFVFLSICRSPTLERNVSCLQNRNLPCVMTWHAERAANLEMRQSAPPSSWC